MRVSVTSGGVCADADKQSNAPAPSASQCLVFMAFLLPLGTESYVSGTAEPSAVVARASGVEREAQMASARPAAEILSSIRDNSCGAPEPVALPQRRTPFGLIRWSRRVSL